MAKDYKQQNEKSDDACSAIMYEVACCEEKRLIRTLFLIGPLLIVCSWLIMVAIHLSVLRLVEHEAMEMAMKAQEEGQAFSQQVYILLQLFWYQMKNDLVILIAIALTVVSIVIAKSKLLSYPFRFREIKKYKLPQ